MAKQEIQVRAYYTYYDNKDGSLTGNIDIFVDEEKGVHEPDVVNEVAEKWRKSGYKGSSRDTIDYTHHEVIH